MSKEQQELLDEVYWKYADSHKYFVDGWLHVIPMYHSKETFVNECKTDTEFSEKWGLKIEERELSLEERFNIKYPGGKFSIFQENYPNTHKRNNPNDLLDAFDIPTKLITITYNDKTIESYE